MFDVFLFNVPYTIMQYVGLGYLFSLYIFQGIKFLVWDLPREKAREIELKQEVERLDKVILYRQSIIGGNKRPMTLNID